LPQCSRRDTCVDDRALPVTPASYCARDNYTLFPLQREFFRNAIMAPDQLRQRVAFALSQILVTSGTDIGQAYAMQRYQQLLADLAFDNFRNVLTRVTLSPVMGNYLDMANNAKADARTGIEPNENYARELLQLFSIGTVELQEDGTPGHRHRGKRGVRERRADAGEDRVLPRRLVGAIPGGATDMIAAAASSCAARPD
jgi:uncharacterized protein (DUF1800 family)